jgi:hypothetical protein
MENRKPFQLKNTLVIYNFLQVIFSTWLFYEVSKTLWCSSFLFCLLSSDHQDPLGFFDDAVDDLYLL